jgi:preprotein translocase subunit SecF
MIHFLKYKQIGFVISVLLLTASIGSIVFNGFVYSIEFVGGTTLEYQLEEEVQEDTVRSLLQNLNIEPKEMAVRDNRFTLRTTPLDEQKEASLQAQLREQTGENLEILRSETVGPSVSQDLVTKTTFALLIGVMIIFGYITYAFKDFRFAIAAIGALLHDIIILLGVYSILSTYTGAEVDTLLVTAVLTTLSLSVHDTIVMFDKVREHKRKLGSEDIEYVANKALTETLVRSLNSSMTTLFMLIALVLIGGDTIRFFAVALLTGIVIGTYSSPFIAVPLMVWLEKRKKD